jgi:ABC-type dipeptide/oligopeptide/nickel transport system permease component
VTVPMGRSGGRRESVWRRPYRASTPRYGPRPVARFLLRRLLGSAIALLVFVVLVFVLIDVAVPFDFATRFQQHGGDADSVREQLGLDRPLPVRLGAFVWGLFRLDLGTSFTGQPVSGIVFGRPLWTTTLIFVTGGVLAFLLGTWLGRVVAWQRRRWVGGVTDGLAVFAATLFPPLLVFLLVRYTEPLLRRIRQALDLPRDPRLTLWDDPSLDEGAVLLRVALGVLVALGAMLLARWLLRRQGRSVWPSWLVGVVALGLAIGWFVTAGFGPHAFDVIFSAPRWENPLSASQAGGGSPFLGIVAFLILAFGEFHLIVETAMVSERSEDYVLTARAKGVATGDIRDLHVARNVALPALSRFAVAVPALLTGLVIVERELELPGLSSTLFLAVEVVDTPVITGVLVVIGLLVLVLRLVLEVVHARLDPRVRSGLLERA